MPSSRIIEAVANSLARVAIAVPMVERALLFGTRRPRLRKHLRLGAIALGYTRVLGRRELRIAHLNGYQYYVNVGESLGIESYFFGSSGALAITRSLIRPGDVCVDAGANAGPYTFLCASIVGPQGNVIAFEPNPEFSSLIAKSVRLNAYDGFVRIREHALDSVTGLKKRFYVSTNPMNTGTSSLVNHGWYISEEQTIEVQTLAFDDFARDAGIGHFRLVKIDVDRAEDAVIDGALNTIAEGRVDFFIIELFMGARAQILLERAGYRAFLISEGKRLVPVTDVEQGRFGDYLFVRPGLEIPSS